LTGVVAEISTQFTVVWRKLQTQLVCLSLHDQQVIAENRYHYVHQDQPEVVVEAIRKMLYSARGA
jgi:hypothetical protein